MYTGFFRDYIHNKIQMIVIYVFHGLGLRIHMSNEISNVYILYLRFETYVTIQSCKYFMKVLALMLKLCTFFSANAKTMKSYFMRCSLMKTQVLNGTLTRTFLLLFCSIFYWNSFIMIFSKFQRIKEILKLKLVWSIENVIPLN